MNKINKEYIAEAHRIFYDETGICISPAIDIALKKILKETQEELIKEIEKKMRKIEHPNLRFKGKICDACSEDFTHNHALKEIINLIKNKQYAKP